MIDGVVASDALPSAQDGACKALTVCAERRLGSFVEIVNRHGQCELVALDERTKADRINRGVEFDWRDIGL